MATKTRKSQFYGYLSLCLFVTLTLFLPWGARADYGLLGIPASGYNLADGESFFLLADSGFGSDEPAVIRLEGPEMAPERYTGVDVVLYRIPNPLEFLRKQPNLHRVRLPGRYDGEGLANAMNQVWDVWYKKSRLGWQRIFSAAARDKVTTQVPLLKQAAPHTYRSQFEDNPQFKPLADFPVVSRFRYPLWQAKPMEPPKEVQVEGSSHEDIQTRPGNVRLPLGRLAPGLYLVEGLLGRYRAVTLVFVADTVAITKTSGSQLLVWTAHKKSGVAVANSKLLLTDGAGTLQSATTSADGSALFERPSPERAYLLAQDQQGGVLVSENFYYDSEIHNAKLFAFTDRPLYRPGDIVRFKLVGRHFQDAQNSVPLEAGPVHLLALDPNGAPVGSATFQLDPVSGGDGSFQLPEQAVAGGYTLRLTYQGEPYAASFRVARYAKPHYDLEVVFDKPGYQTGETVTGVVRAAYPGGQPVAGLTLELHLRTQTLALSDYEHRQQGRFPVALKNQQITADNQGEARFALPAAAEPSRYTLRVVGSDGSSYRVSAIRDLLLDSHAPRYVLESAKQLSQPGETVHVALRRLPSPGGRAVSWEAVRLEDQSVRHGPLDGETLAIPFAQAGTYTLTVKDAENHVAGSLAHWVAGEGLQGAPEGITILLDKARYRDGETVQALLSFPEPVQEALLTLERDRVHHLALLSRGADWLRLTRKNPRQWAVEIPVTALFQPNVTFSVLAVRKGEFTFQNKGILVENDPIAIALTPDRPHYLPGERVTVAMQTAVAGKPVAAELAVGVVDEMVYVLQPELAPDIRDFFGHLRRNQVRTLSSLNFHTYDQAVSALDQESQTFQRPLKLLERPRRENIDTAAWFPRLQTDAQGRGHFSFVMPDSLTRWRITARATTRQGRVGQQTGPLLSEKAAYLKWTSPNRLRQGDEIQGMLLAFNRGSEPLAAVVTLTDGGKSRQIPTTLRPGGNHLSLPITALGDTTLEATLQVADEVVDRLSIPLTVVPVPWLEEESCTLPLQEAATPVTLPAGAREVRVSLSRGAMGQWWRVAAELMDYPYGCVEQTASRLIPLALAYRSVLHRGEVAPALAEGLRNRLANHRFRLAQMAGPEAGFGWWGDQGAGSPFFTAYAYFADHLALSVLGLEAPPEHWMKLLEVYRKGAAQESPLRRTLALWLAAELKLPVRTLALGVMQEVLDAPAPKADPRGARDNLVLGEAATLEERDLTLLLLHHLLSRQGMQAPALAAASRESEKRLAERGGLLSRAALLLVQSGRGKEGVEEGQVAALLTGAATGAATLDRALALLFLDRVVGGNAPTREVPALLAPWIRQDNPLGGVAWRYPEARGDQVVVALAEAPADKLTAHLSYRHHARDKGTGLLEIQRQLYRLTPARERPEPDYWSDNPVETLFEAQPVATDEPLEATALYLDEVTVTAKKGPHRYGLLEVPLPPGGDLDPFTWGMAVTYGEDEEPVLLTESHGEKGEAGYAVPVPLLQEGQTFRHLVRFPQRGTMHLPPVRYFSMYNPEERARAAAGMTLVVR